MVMQSPPQGGPLVVFAGGGTGGHLYPALSIVDAIRRLDPQARFLFVGTDRPIDRRILGPAGCDLIEQSLKPIHPAPWRWPGIYRGLRRSRLHVRERFRADRPAVVVGTGGLSSIPAVREAARTGIPVALLNPDALPGRANRYLSALADVAFVQWSPTKEHLPKCPLVLVSGCAVRPAFNVADRASGVARFGLDASRRTLLVTGASQGARTINQAVIANAALLGSKPDWQVLHITGEPDHDSVRAAYAEGSIDAIVMSFTEHMADALAACDLVVARSGASTLAEITAVGRASVLMPYPFHRDRHQLANARCLVRASAARIVHDRVDVERNAPALRAVLDSLMDDDPARTAMAGAARRLGNGQAAAEIAHRILKLASGEVGAGVCESVEAFGSGSR